MKEKVGSVAVLGGGISGMQSALDLAESGLKVYLVDDKPAIGGVMAQLDKTFPTNDCAMCTMAPRLVEIERHKDIEIITLSDIEKIEGEPGNYKVILNKKPRYIDEDKCTGCQRCVSVCPTGAITGPRAKPHNLDANKCIKCRACYEICRFDKSLEMRLSSDPGRHHEHFN